MRASAAWRTGIWLALALAGGCGPTRSLERSSVAHRPSVAGAVPALAPTPAPASAVVPAPAPSPGLGSAAAPEVPFALVAIEWVKLHKLLERRVLASAPGGVLHELGHDGRITCLESVFAATKATVGELGTIGGSWPGTLFIERYRIAPTTSASTTGLWVRGDAVRASIAQQASGAYWLPPCEWKGGALLTVRAQGSSEAFGMPLDRTARFEVVGGAKQAAPQFPRDALFDDAFVAYPSGRLFALGGRRSRPVVENDASEYEQEHGYMLDGAMVWQSDGAGGKLEAMQLPGTTPRDRLRGGGLVKGKAETDTLAWGSLEVWRNRASDTQSYLARFGPSGWKRVPISRDASPRQLDAGDDGSVWAIRSSDAPGLDADTWLERVSLAPDGAVALERIELTVKPEWQSLGEDAHELNDCQRLRPRRLAVLGANDIWLTAECVTARGSGPTLLLHTGPQGPLVTFKTFERLP